MIWIESAGGPLVLMDETARWLWQGIDNSDYSDACDCGDDCIEIMDRPHGQIVVFSGDVRPLAWHELGPDGRGCFVRWIWGASDAAVEDWIRKLAPLAQGETTEFELRSGPMWVFDAALPGDCAAEDAHFKLDWLPGKYLIGTQLVEPDSETKLILHPVWRQD